ncbi:penicillin-binding transpeptidase domain-containing protein [Bacillus sp. FJAT-47783]|uniref:penicillin-binding transpeptidase domain-containing protein n=1 Tax=Bacillus sp. FJAT-47783 TaxID=2922712 RepID=UPI001FAC0B8F|nr:penicillin-binding transpeptidase domain-containing protein [Bacillus sp. FJAT-47783]
MRKGISILFFTFFLLLSGCSEKPNPEDAFHTFITEWNNQKFDKMYDSLSSEVKEKISKKEFVNRYSSIYEDIQVQNLKVEFHKPEEEVKPNEENEVKLPFSVSMDTVAGPVSFDHEAVLQLEEEGDNERWGVQWNSSFIFKQLKDGDSVKLSHIAPIRGQIFDRNGQGLAVNEQVTWIGVVPAKMGDQKEEIIQQLSKTMKMSSEAIKKELEQGWVKNNPEQFVPLKGVPSHEKLYDGLADIPSVQTMKKTERVYPLSEKAAHLTGFIRQMYEDEAKEYAKKGYSSYEFIGAKGLEQVYEDVLHGETGWTLSVKQSGEVITSKPKVDGKDVHLTIDRNVQEDLYTQLKDVSGTAVAIHPTTGETLAMVSTPAYNPNDYILGFDEGEVEQLKNDQNKPFSAKFNKVFSPGSTLKPLTAAIGLEAGTLDPQKEEVINGKTWKKDSSWGGYAVTRVSETDSRVNLEDALVRSDNIYFARKALEMGADTFEKGLEKLKFKEKFDFPFPITPSSISNDSLAENEILLADSSYGQGQIQMSPFHLAMSYTIFVNEGKMISPYLQKEGGPAKSEQMISPKNAALIHQHLRQVVTSPNGTAPEANVSEVAIAGKTGTAELKKAGETSGQENGWFVAYEAEKKNLLIAMMIENVPEGSHSVTPFVTKVFEQYTP